MESVLYDQDTHGMKEETYNLNSIDPEDIGHVLNKIQRSFNIKLDNKGLRRVDTFGDLCEAITNKLSLETGDTCTTQHGFYVLRHAIAAVTGTDKRAITPQTRLPEILPKERRSRLIAEIEGELGFETNLLRPRRWIVALFVLTLTGSLVLGFYNWPIALAGLLSSGICLKRAGKFGKEMHLKTVGELAHKISKECYVRSKRNSCTISKNEVEQKVRELFVHELKLEPIVLTRKSRF